MSKLISINGYDIKVSKKEVANKLEMISNDCNVEYSWQMTDIYYVMRDALNRLNANHGVVTNAINKCISFTYRSDGNIIGVSLKSNVNLTQCVEMLMEICDELLSRGNVEYVDKLLPNYRPDWFTTDYTKMSDNELHDVVLSQLDYINRDLMETCVYNDLNGNGKYVRVGVNEFMDVTPALAEFNSRFGITEIFCMIYSHFESRKTHVEYDSFDDTMYIVEVIPYDDDGNIIEYGYYVGDYYVRYKGITENIEIVEVEENETEIENTNETKNEKEVKKAMKKTNRDFKVNGVNYTVVNNPNYNKNCSYEPTCQKYYAMKLLSTDGVTKSWVKINIPANTIDTVKEKVAEWENFMQYVENYDNTKTAEVTNKNNVEPAEPVTPVKDTNNLTLSDTAKTHIRNAYNYVIGELINGLCDNKPVSNEYKECFKMLHGGEKLVNHIYNECMENGFDVGWCGLGQSPAEIKKYDSWLIKNHIRNMLELDNIFSLPADNSTVTNEIYNIPVIKMNSIIDLIEQCNSTMEKTMLLDYVSFETGVSYDAIKQIYDVYIKETFLDDDETTFDSVLEEIYKTGWVVGSNDDIDANFKRILGDDEIPF